MSPLPPILNSTTLQHLFKPFQKHSKYINKQLYWSSLQPLLETAVPNVLIILDCCFAANAARDTTTGTTKELLAACGRENPTLGVGERSFTSALIDELKGFGSDAFTVAMLHSRLVTMRWRLEYTPVSQFWLVAYARQEKHVPMILRASSYAFHRASGAC